MTRLPAEPPTASDRDPDQRPASLVNPDHIPDHDHAPAAQTAVCAPPALRSPDTPRVGISVLPVDRNPVNAAPVDGRGVDGAMTVDADLVSAGALIGARDPGSAACDGDDGDGWSESADRDRDGDSDGESAVDALEAFGDVSDITGRNPFALARLDAVADWLLAPSRSAASARRRDGGRTDDVRPGGVDAVRGLVRLAVARVACGYAYMACDAASVAQVLVDDAGNPENFARDMAWLLRSDHLRGAARLLVDDVVRGGVNSDSGDAGTEIDDDAVEQRLSSALDDAAEAVRWLLDAAKGAGCASFGAAKWSGVIDLVRLRAGSPEACADRLSAPMTAALPPEVRDDARAALAAAVRLAVRAGGDAFTARALLADAGAAGVIAEESGLPFSSARDELRLNAAVGGALLCLGWLTPHPLTAHERAFATSLLDGGPSATLDALTLARVRAAHAGLSPAEPVSPALAGAALKAFEVACGDAAGWIMRRFERSGGVVPSAGAAERLRAMLAYFVGMRATAGRDRDIPGLLSPLRSPRGAAAVRNAASAAWPLAGLGAALAERLRGVDVGMALQDAATAAQAAVGALRSARNAGEKSGGVVAGESAEPDAVRRVKARPESARRNADADAGMVVLCRDLPAEEQGKRFGALTKSLPLLAPKSPIDDIERMLIAEQPHMSGAIRAVTDDLRLAEAFGSPRIKIRPLLIVGPPGAGKTRLCRRLSETLGAPMLRINAAGSADNRDLSGSARAWAHAEPSALIKFIADCGAANPICLIDEVEKASRERRNGCIIDTLLLLLERESARAWRDECLSATVDLSHVGYLLTANSTEGLPGPLLDRVRIERVGAPDVDALDGMLSGFAADLAAEFGGDTSTSTSALTSIPPRLDEDAVARLRRVLRETGSARALQDAWRGEIIAALTGRRNGRPDLRLV